MPAIFEDVTVVERVPALVRLRGSHLSGGQYAKGQVLNFSLMRVMPTFAVPNGRFYLSSPISIIGVQNRIDLQPIPTDKMREDNL